MAPSSVYPISIVVIILMAISSCNEAGAATWSQNNGGWRVQEDNGHEYWVGPNGREQRWGNVPSDKQLTRTGSYGWTPDSRFPPIDVEKTRKIPWSDVGKSAGAVALKYGTKVLPWVGFGSIIISAGYDICKIVEGDWCTQEQETIPNSTSGNYSCGPYDGRMDPVSVAEKEAQLSATAWVCSPYGNMTLYSEGQAALKALHPEFKVAQGYYDYSIYLVTNVSGGDQTTTNKEVPVDPTVVASAIEQSVSAGNSVEQVANDIVTNSPADAKSNAPLSDSYTGPASVSGTPTTSTTSSTNAQGESVQTTTTSTPTMSVSYGDNVTINEITNVTNTTTTTTHADGSTTTETEEQKDVQCKDCGKVTDPGAPEQNFPENKEEDFQQYINPIMEGGAAGECPVPFQVAALGQDITVSVEPLCRLATDVRPYFLTMMLLISTMVAFGPSRRG